MKRTAKARATVQRKKLVALAGAHSTKERRVPYMHGHVTALGLGWLGGEPVRIPRSLRKYLHRDIPTAQDADMRPLNEKSDADWRRINIERVGV